jgi:hypothetical protein
VELIHSFGILPVRIWGQADDVQTADSLLQPYIGSGGHARLSA